jgi:hypothetical protein
MDLSLEEGPGQSALVLTVAKTGLRFPPAFT